MKVKLTREVFHHIADSLYDPGSGEASCCAVENVLEREFDFHADEARHVAYAIYADLMRPHEGESPIWWLRNHPECANRDWRVLALLFAGEALHGTVVETGEDEE